jgi:hypothetical protein
LIETTASLVSPRAIGKRKMQILRAIIAPSQAKETFNVRRGIQIREQKMFFFRRIEIKPKVPNCGGGGKGEGGDLQIDQQRLLFLLRAHPPRLSNGCVGEAGR